MYRTLCTLAAAAAALAGCVCTPAPDCGTRAGGAFITFGFPEIDHPVTLWIENDAFIDDAISYVNEPDAPVPSFGQVVAGTDCDARWSWHVDPAQASWSDVTIELCDAAPAYIEEHRDAWIAEVGQWCPWSAMVTAVDDRRAGK